MFNESKCSVLTISRKQSPISFDYKLTDIVLSRRSSIKDLGVLFRADLRFSDHVKIICAKAYRTLGFVLRQARHLDSIAAIKLLYNSFVRSILESNAAIWSPHEAKYKLMLEKLQKKFLRFLYYRQYGYSVGYPNIYPSLFLLGMLGYNSLEYRRNIYLIEHFVQLIRGKISNPSVLELISLNVPDNYVQNRRRRPKLFALPWCRLILAMESPLRRALTLLNGLVTWDQTIDIFCSPMAELRSSAGAYVEKL